jgi:hypothetical protein
LTDDVMNTVGNVTDNQTISQILDDITDTTPVNDLIEDLAGAANLDHLVDQLNLDDIIPDDLTVGSLTDQLNMNGLLHSGGHNLNGFLHSLPNRITKITRVVDDLPVDAPTGTALSRFAYSDHSPYAHGYQWE